MMKKIYSILFLFIFVFTCIKAQDVFFSADIDKTDIYIGQQAHISLEVSQPENTYVQLPLFSDTIVSGLEIVSMSAPDTIRSENNRIQIKQDIIVTSFDTAFYYIPPLELKMDSVVVAKTSPMALKVLTYDVNAGNAYVMDIKPILSIPYTWKEIGFTLLIIWLTVFVLFIVVLLYVRLVKKKSILLKKEKPEIPPHIVALEQLDKLKGSLMWRTGKDKEYHTELTDILRIYIEKRFRIGAMEMTSDEILNELRRIDLTVSIKELEQILRLSDYVKFAKLKPSENENETSLTNAYLFVNHTKIEYMVVEEDDKKEQEVSNKEDKKIE